MCINAFTGGRSKMKNSWVEGAFMAENRGLGKGLAAVLVLCIVFGSGVTRARAEKPPGRECADAVEGARRWLAMRQHVLGPELGERARRWHHGSADSTAVPPSSLACPPQQARGRCRAKKHKPTVPMG